MVPGRDLCAQTGLEQQVDLLVDADVVYIPASGCRFQTTTVHPPLVLVNRSRPCQRLAAQHSPRRPP